MNVPAFLRKKAKYLRVITFKSDKSTSINYYKDGKVPATLVVNPNNVFLAKNGYRTVVTNDKASETINPLDFKSAYDAETFKTAINTNFMKQVFESLKTSKIDLSMILAIASIGISLVTLYFILKGQGVI